MGCKVKGCPHHDEGSGGEDPLARVDVELEVTVVEELSANSPVLVVPLRRLVHITLGAREEAQEELGGVDGDVRRCTTRTIYRTRRGGKDGFSESGKTLEVRVVLVGLFHFFKVNKERRRGGGV